MQSLRTDRPIIFSGPMVRALLEGRKTMTRRLLKPQPETAMVDGKPLPVSLLHVEGDPRPRITIGRVITKQEVRFAPGDRLWVRENLTRSGGYIQYAADHKTFDGLGRLWPAHWKQDPRPSIHMPRWASRLTLVVTAVKIEPLLDISEDDARAEGFAAGRLDDGFGPRDFGDGWTVSSPGTFCSAAGMFQETWAKLHPEWDGFSSPYVIALTFTVHKQNIDTLPAQAAA